MNSWTDGLLVIGNRPTRILQPLAIIVANRTWATAFPTIITSITPLIGPSSYGIKDVAAVVQVDVHTPPGCSMMKDWPCKRDRIYRELKRADWSRASALHGHGRHAPHRCGATSRIGDAIQVTTPTDTITASTNCLA
ncbi:MAG: hypothetical protein QM674_00155 [Burkholderiaceae bacterium]